MFTFSASDQKKNQNLTREGGEKKIRKEKH